MKLYPGYHAEQNPNHPAYVIEPAGITVTYGELEKKSNQGAHLFRQLGLKPGDHIAIAMENHPRFFEIVWAAQRSGLYYTPISYYLKQDEIAYIANDCGAKVLIASKQLEGQIDRLPSLCPKLEKAYMVSGVIEGYESWEDAVADMLDTPIADECEGRDMLYSSGTTGNPKGIKLPLEEGAFW